MDFAFSEEQVSIRDLARSILEKEVDHERLKRIEAGSEWFDRPLWRTLAEAGLVGIAVPEEAGGMGFGFQEVCILLEEIGRAVAPVPVVPTMVLGALPIAKFGTLEQQKTWLRPVASGDVVLSAGLADTNSDDVAKPATFARRDGSSWILDGEKAFVPMGAQANRIVIPATCEGGDVGLFLVDPQTEGVELQTSFLASGENIATMRIAGLRLNDDDLIGGAPGDGAEQVDWLYQHALVAVAALQLGVSSRALEITSSYVSERVQFGVPIGSFQAVQHRAANGYIDVQAMRWVMWRAAWKLSQGVPAHRDVMVAKFWAADGGSRLANSAQHLHGGIGVDRDYPIHRYFLWSKSLELTLGGVPHQLTDLGRDMARSGPAA